MDSLKLNEDYKILSLSNRLVKLPTDLLIHHKVSYIFTFYSVVKKQRNYRI